MTHIAARSNVRLAELLAVLSLATDLGMGLPMEHVLRQCVLSLRLARTARGSRMTDSSIGFTEITTIIIALTTRDRWGMGQIPVDYLVMLAQV